MIRQIKHRMRGGREIETLPILLKNREKETTGNQFFYRDRKNSRQCTLGGRTGNPVKIERLLNNFCGKMREVKEFPIFSCLLLLLSFSASPIHSECSRRDPDGADPTRRIAGEDEDGGFYLVRNYNSNVKSTNVGISFFFQEVSGAPAFYQPGALYTVSLRVSRSGKKLFYWTSGGGKGDGGFSATPCERGIRESVGWGG